MMTLTFDLEEPNLIFLKIFGYYIHCVKAMLMHLILLELLSKEISNCALTGNGFVMGRVAKTTKSEKSQNRVYLENGASDEKNSGRLFCRSYDELSNGVNLESIRPTVTEILRK